MDKRKRQMILRWGLVLINMVLIFLFSSQTGDDSGILSSWLAAWIAQVKVLGWIFQYIKIRKAAHFMIYFTLGIFAIRAVMLHTRETKAQIAGTLLICFIYACTDEFHQSYIPGRGPSFRDVMIDTCGALTGLFSVLGYLKIRKKAPGR